jgi:hypothetical protein
MIPALDPPFEQMSPEELLSMTTQTCVHPITRRTLLDQPRMPIEGLINLAMLDVKAFAAHPTVRLNAATDFQFIEGLHLNLLAALIKKGLLFGPARLHQLVCSKKMPIQIVRAIARSPHMTEAIAKDLLTKDKSVEMELAANPRISPEILMQLPTAYSLEMAVVLAERQDLPGEMVQNLLKDGRPAVLWRLANNPAMPTEVLEVLAKDDRPGIRAQARERLGCGWSTEGLRAWLDRPVEPQ